MPCESNETHHDTMQLNLILISNLKQCTLKQEVVMQGEGIATMGEPDSLWTAAKSQSAISRTSLGCAAGEKGFPTLRREWDKREQSCADDDSCSCR